MQSRFYNTYGIIYIYCIISIVPANVICFVSTSLQRSSSSSIKRQNNPTAHCLSPSRADAILETTPHTAQILFKWFFCVQCTKACARSLFLLPREGPFEYSNCLFGGLEQASL